MYLNALNVELRESGAVASHPATATAGQTRRVGTAQNDVFNSAPGEILEGGLGDDRYNLWNARWTVVEARGQGIDSIYGYFWGHITLPDNVENLYLMSPGSTSGTGNALDNIIVAGTVGATLNGGAGNDVLVGGTGADLFVITAGNGSDAIYQFTPGHDAIRLEGYGVTSFAQLKGLAVQAGPDVRFTFGNGEQLVLRDVSLGNLSAQDFGMLAARPTATAGQTLLASAGNVGIANGWYALNNVWNPGAMVQGTDYIISGLYDRGDMTSGTSFTWTFPFSTDVYQPVRAYPAVIFGVSPHGNYWANDTDKAHVLPVRVSDLQSFDLTHDLSYTGQASGFNVAYDIWFTSRPNGDASTIMTELMIWLHEGSVAPFGPVVGRIDAGGFSGRVHHSGTYVAIVADRELLSTTLDLVAIVDALKALGVMSGDSYLAAIELGSEVMSGSGSLTINNFEFTVESAVTGGTLVKQVTGGVTHVEARTALANYVAPAEVHDIVYTGTDAATLRGNALSNTVRGGAGADFIDMRDGGVDRVFGGAGNDGILFGAAFTADDYVDGGEGDDDQLGLQGDYALTLGVNSLISIETLALLSGSNTRFGGSGTARHSYDITTVDANVAAGKTLTVHATGLLNGENLTFDGSAERDGSFLIFGGLGVNRLTGGAGNDGFWFGDGRFTASDRIDGGGGTDNQIGLTGRYDTPLVLEADTITNIQVIALLSGADRRYGSGRVTEYNLVLHDGNVAAGETLTVTGTGLRAGEVMIVDASAERDGSLRLYGGAGDDVLIGGAGADLIIGGGGADRLRGNGGGDTFAYIRLSDSTPTAYDHILDFGSGDRIDLSRIDAIAGTTVNENFTFIGDRVFSGAAGELRISNISGDWLVEGDVDGDRVADLTILVSTIAGHDLTVGDLIL